MIDLETIGDRITLARLRHGKVNALDLALARELCRVLADADPERVLVLTGNGSVFSAGVDLFAVLDGGAAYLDEFLPAAVAAFEALFRFPGPLVAAIDGAAIAGGCVFACAGDARVMADGKARIGVPELLVGVPFPSIALEIVRSAVAPSVARDLIITGRSLHGPEAVAAGLVDEAVPPDRVLPRALERADALAHLPATSFALVKAHLRAPALAAAAASAAARDAQVAAAWRDPQIHARIRRYMEQTVGRRS